MKYYKTDNLSRYAYLDKVKISEIEVDRDSESSIWIDGKRHSKNTEYYMYHPTYSSAKHYIISCLIEHRDDAERKMNNMIKLISIAQALGCKPEELKGE